MLSESFFFAGGPMERVFSGEPESTHRPHLDLVPTSVPTGLMRSFQRFETNWLLYTLGIWNYRVVNCRLIIVNGSPR